MIPTALRELLRVHPPVDISDEAAECRFTWKWKPNKIGKAVGAPDTTETSTVRFFRQEDGWFLEETSIQ